MEILSFENFLSEHQIVTMTPKEICDYITSITPSNSDVPDFFFELIRKSPKKFILQKVRIKDLLEKDPSLKEYVEHSEERYGNSNDEDEHVPANEDIDLPIVVFNGEVMDGYNRTLVHVLMGEEFIKAYVA